MKAHNLDDYLALDYPVEIRAIPDRLGGGYAACIPCLGRWAFYADGDTIEEAIGRLTEVKTALFEDMIQAGRKVPAPPPIPEEEELDHFNGRVLVRMPSFLHSKLATHAEKSGSSLNQYLVAILAMHVGGEDLSQRLVSRLTQWVSDSAATWWNTPQPYNVQMPSSQRPDYDDTEIVQFPMTPAQTEIRFASRKAA